MSWFQVLTKGKGGESSYRQVSWILETCLPAKVSVTDVDTSLNLKRNSSLLCEQPALPHSEYSPARQPPCQSRDESSSLYRWVSESLLSSGCSLVFCCFCGAKKVGPNGFLQCVPEGGECVQGVRARWDLRSYQDLADLQVSCTYCNVALFVGSAGMQLCVMCSSSTYTACLRKGSPACAPAHLST